MISALGAHSATVVEVLGLPAAGKTTAVETIASSAIVVLSRHRSAANVPAYASAAVRLTPTLVTMAANGCSRQDRNRLIRLGSSAAIARRSARRGADAFVFDQGPVFLLRQLAGGRGAACRKGIEPRLSEYLRLWARTLDLVIVLDAADAVLLERIRRREKSHPLQYLSDPKAREHLATERRAFDRVLGELAANGPVPTRRIDTSLWSTAETGAAVRAAVAELTSV